VYSRDTGRGNSRKGGGGALLMYSAWTGVVDARGQRWAPRACGPQGGALKGSSRPQLRGDCPPLPHTRTGAHYPAPHPSKRYSHAAGRLHLEVAEDASEHERSTRRLGLALCRLRERRVLAQRRHAHVLVRVLPEAGQDPLHRRLEELAVLGERELLLLRHVAGPERAPHLRQPLLTYFLLPPFLHRVSVLSEEAGGPCDFAGTRGGRLRPLRASRDAACPISTGCGARRVRLVRGEGGEAASFSDGRKQAGKETICPWWCYTSESRGGAGPVGWPGTNR
jgi:hypothetical protein